MSNPTETRDEFYIGYLGAPPSHARFARGAGSLLLAGFGILGAVLAAGQSDPGPGTWEQNEAASYTGTIHCDPYPRLVPDSPGPGELSMLLVEEGKFGADLRARPFDNQRVRVRATLIRRGGLAALELVPTADAIAADTSGPPSPLRPSTAASASHISFEGEIVDPKCYLGVMRPGRGKPHLACAELCIAGGVPPVLVTHSPGDPEEGACYLLVDSQGGRANALVRGRTGRPVAISGVLVPGDWPAIRIESIR